MESNITPPREYPRTFIIRIINSNVTDNMPNRVRGIFNERLYGYLYGIANINLNTFVESLRKDYELFHSIQTIEENSNLFTSLEELNRELDNLYKNAIDGDILFFLNRAFFIYGDYNNRRIKLIENINQYFPGDVLSEKSLKSIKYYNIHELKDINKYYPDTIFKWIEIPNKYFPPQIFDIPNEKLIFLMTNKNGYERYKDLPIIPLDIGDNEKYIIYVTVPKESNYYRNFLKKPTEKI